MKQPIVLSMNFATQCSCQVGSIWQESMDTTNALLHPKFDLFSLKNSHCLQILQDNHLDSDLDHKTRNELNHIVYAVHDQETKQPTLTNSSSYRSKIGHSNALPTKHPSNHRKELVRTQSLEELNMGWKQAPKSCDATKAWSASRAVPVGHHSADEGDGLDEQHPRCEV